MLIPIDSLELHIDILWMWTTTCKPNSPPGLGRTQGCGFWADTQRQQSLTSGADSVMRLNNAVVDNIQRLQKNHMPIFACGSDVHFSPPMQGSCHAGVGKGRPSHYTKIYV